MTVPVRILADGAPIGAGPKLARDYYGALSFRQSPIDTEKLVLDYTGYLGSETISGSVWTTQSMTVASTAIDGKKTTGLVSDVPYCSWGQVRNTITTSGGRVHTVLIRFYAPQDEYYLVDQ